MHQGDGRMKYIGVLGLQGGVEEHHHLLAQLPEVKSIDVKYISQLEEIDGLIIPGGESTTLGRLLRVFNMLEPLKQKVLAGLPVWGTCAGMILLAKEIEEETTKHLEVMDITVRRNAYGRQLGSFETKAPVKGVGEDIDMVFIRAPYIESVGENVEILSTVDGNIVAAQEDNMLVTSFHPELTEDLRLHKYFINIVSKSINNINCIVAQ